MSKVFNLINNSIFHKAYVWVIFGFILFASYNAFNLWTIKKYNPVDSNGNTIGLVENTTVFSVDNEYYLTPVENYLEGDGWRRSLAVGKGGYYRRTPGYSIIYLAARKITQTKKQALTFMVVFQSLFYLLSIYWLFNILKFLNFSKIITFSIIPLYISTPWFNIYPFFTLTESITTYLTLGVIFYVLKAKNSPNDKSKTFNYIFASSLLAYLILSRPVMGMLAIIFPIFIYFDYFKKSILSFIQKCLIIAIIPTIFLGAWTIRNYNTTREIVLLERPSDPETVDLLKPGMNSIWSLTKCWGEYHFWENEYILFNAVLSGDSICEKEIEVILDSWPKDVVQDIGREKLKTGLIMHKDVLREYKPYFEKEIAMPSSYSSLELKQVKYFENLKNEYSKNNWITAYIKAPFIYLKYLVLHSNTSNVYFFQETLRHIKLLNVTRLSLVSIHVILYIILFISILYFTLNRTTWIPEIIFPTLIPVLYIIFFIFIHREIEQRYMLPLLPLLIINAGNFITTILNKREINKER